MDCLDPTLNCARRNPKACGGCTCGLFILVLLVASFSSLEYTEVGLNFSSLSNTVVETPYTAGLHMLGPFNSFIKFPSTVQSIQFSHEQDSNEGPLRSRTSDGLEVQLEVSFQYQLNGSRIFHLYQKFGTKYKPIYVSLAIDSVTKIATEFNATAFFNDRTVISLRMEEVLKEEFNRQAFSNVPFFQLRAVSLPSDFEHAIQETEVKKQDIQTATAEKENTEVQMMTKVLQAQQQALSIGLQANATAQATMLNMNAFVSQFLLTQQNQAESFAPIHDRLGKNETLFLEYMRTRVLRDHPDHLSVVNMPLS